MNKAQKRFYGAALTLSTVASVIAPVAVSAATTYEDAKAKVDAAKATPVFKLYNEAYAAVLEVKDADKQAALLNELAPLWEKVATKDVLDVLTAMDALAKEKDLKNYYDLYAQIEKDVTNSFNNAYLMGELTSWGREAVFTPEVVAATDAIMKAWADKTPANIAAAKEAIAKVTKASNIEWLNNEVKSIETSMATTVTKVEAVGAKKIKVTFNKAVDTAKADVKLYKGIAPVAANSVTWNDAKTEATIETVIKFGKGDYTVKVAGLTDTVADAKVTLADEKVEVLEITSTVIQKTASAPVAYTLKNQYGEDVAGTPSTITVTAFNTKTGTGVVAAVAADGKVTLSNAGSVVDEKVVVTITHNATGKTATATLNTVAAAKIGSIVPGEVKLPSGVTRVTVSNSNDDLKLTYTAQDQYGNSVKLTASSTSGSAIEAADGIKIISSNNNIIDPANVKTNADKEITFRTGATSGNVTLTFVTLATGQSTSVTITVNDVAKAKAFSLVQPTTLVTANKSVTVDYIATNQFDENVAKKDFTSAYRTASNITWVSTKPSVVDPTNPAHLSWNAQNELVITPATSGSVTLTPYVNGVAQGSISLDVQAAIVPTKIIGVKDLTTLSVQDGEISVKASNLKVVDQYGNTMSLPDGWTAKLTLKDAAETSFDLGNETDYTATSGQAITLTSDGNSYAKLKGLSANGSETIKVVLNDGTEDKADTAYEFSLTKVASDVVTSYAFKDAGLFYGNSNNNSSTFAKTVSVVGKDAAGNAVALKPGTVTHLTSNSADFVVDPANMKVWSLKKGTATLTAWKGTDAVATIEVTSSDATPVVSSISFDKSSYDVAGVANSTATPAVITIKDQYGAAIGDANGKYYGSDDNVAVVATNGTLTIKGTGKITLTYISGSGVVKTATVNVTKN